MSARRAQVFPRATCSEEQLADLYLSLPELYE